MWTSIHSKAGFIKLQSAYKLSEDFVKMQILIKILGEFWCLK